VRSEDLTWLLIIVPKDINLVQCSRYWLLEEKMRKNPKVQNKLQQITKTMAYQKTKFYIRLERKLWFEC